MANKNIDDKTLNFSELSIEERAKKFLEDYREGRRMDYGCPESVKEVTQYVRDNGYFKLDGKSEKGFMFGITEKGYSFIED